MRPPFSPPLEDEEKRKKDLSEENLLMMKKYCCRLSFAVLLCFSGILLVSCSLFPANEYIEPAVYDIGIPEETEQALPYDVEIQPFLSEGASRYKMMYRLDDNRLHTDDYNRWTQPPGPLLTRYLRMAFAGRDVKAKPIRFRVSGTILVFEADLKQKLVRMFVSCRIAGEKSASGEKSVSAEESMMFSEPLKDTDPASVADAMSAVAGQFVRKLRQDMDLLAEQLK